MSDLDRPNPIERPMPPKKPLFELLGKKKSAYFVVRGGFQVTDVLLGVTLDVLPSDTIRIRTVDTDESVEFWLEIYSGDSEEAIDVQVEGWTEVCAEPMQKILPPSPSEVLMVSTGERNAIDAGLRDVLGGLPKVTKI